jgi:hypothetical protein
MERQLFALFLLTLNDLSHARRRPPKCQYSDRDIVCVLVWAILHDRPIDWACRRENWPYYDRTRRLPSGSTMSRRLRRDSIQQLLREILFLLAVPVPKRLQTYLLDGKPLTISKHSSDPDAGFGYAIGLKTRGYKLHYIADIPGNALDYLVLPLNISEQAAAKIMLRRLRLPEGAILLADANYDCNELYEIAGRQDVQMVAARRYTDAEGVGHHWHSQYRLRALELLEEDPDILEPRRRIEGHFGTMGNVIGGLAPLPNTVRRLHRVERYVTVKLIIDALHRRRRYLAAAA